MLVLGLEMVPWHTQVLAEPLRSLREEEDSDSRGNEPRSSSRGEQQTPTKPLWRRRLLLAERIAELPLEERALCWLF